MLLKNPAPAEGGSTVALGSLLELICRLPWRIVNGKLLPGKDTSARFEEDSVLDIFNLQIAVYTSMVAKPKTQRINK
jgi:hypothetical protein